MLSQIDMRRGVLVMTLIEEYGFEADLAAKAALAAHPLDDDPVPSRAFEKQVRKVSRQYGRVLRGLRGKPQEAELLMLKTLRTLKSYKDLAIQHGEGHYINRYDKALISEPPTIPPQNETPRILDAEVDRSWIRKWNKTPRILDAELELALANLALAAGLPKTDLRCRMVFPPDAGFLKTGTLCRYTADAAVHETNHSYLGPDDVIIKTCQVGHRYCAPAEMPDWECVRCRVDALFPGWKPSGDIGVWDSVPADQRP